MPASSASGPHPDEASNEELAAMQEQLNEAQESIMERERIIHRLTEEIEKGVDQAGLHEGIVGPFPKACARWAESTLEQGEGVYTAFVKAVVPLLNSIEEPVVGDEPDLRRIHTQHLCALCHQVLRFTERKESPTLALDSSIPSYIEPQPGFTAA